jgi:D-alanyl-D-alanine carboxypeptidase
MSLQVKQLIKPLQYCAIFLLLPLFLSCTTISLFAQDVDLEENLEVSDEDLTEDAAEDNYLIHISNAIVNSKLPLYISEKILENITESRDFIDELLVIIGQDPYLWILVDKVHSLGSNYAPDDLVVLTGGSYNVNEPNLLLRRAAAASLEEMAAAARSERIILLVSYAYRSYTRQIQSYQMHVRNLGQREADRISARPGHSQHQLGLAVDFGSVNNTFARTPQGIWISNNASRFGWSLSYPQGYEHITGYRWESWHYRYVGRELAKFIDNYFNGIQQYALMFIREFVNMQEDDK